MAIRYAFVPDKSYYRTLLARYEKQRPSSRGRLPVRVFLLLVVLVGLWGYGYATGAGWADLVGCVVAFMSVLSFVALVFPKLVLLRQARNRPDFNTRGEVSLSEEGIFIAGPGQAVEWPWEAYPAAARFPDGILLMRKGAIRWLPDAALEQGTPREATELVQSKTQLRHVGRSR